MMQLNDTDRRQYQRLPIEMWVEESSERELYFQRGSNISLGGMYLERTVPHPRGTVVNLRFTLPGDNAPVSVRGEIVNVGEDSTQLGMGVKFLDLSDEHRSKISSFLTRNHVDAA